MNETKAKKHPLVITLCNLNMSQLVHELTRPVSRTCVDHIWCSHPNELYNARTLPSGISDHFPIAVTQSFKRVKNNEWVHKTIIYQDIKSENEDQFISSQKNAPWDCALVFDDSNDVVDCLYDIFNGIVDEHLPLKQKRVKRNVQPK